MTRKVLSDKGVQNLKPAEPGKRAKAKALFAAAQIDPGQDFDTLNPEQLTAIESEAAAVHQAKYGKPMSGATFIRKRYELLRQRAKI